MNNSFNLGLSHIGLFVKNIEESKKFYMDILDLECTYEDTIDSPDGEVKLCFISKNDLKLELVQQPVYDECEKPGIVHHIAINIKDIDKVIKTLNNRGIEFTDKEVTHAPHLFEKGSKWIFFKGPDGENLELNEIL